MNSDYLLNLVKAGQLKTEPKSLAEVSGIPAIYGTACNFYYKKGTGIG